MSLDKVTTPLPATGTRLAPPLAEGKTPQQEAVDSARMLGAVLLYLLALLLGGVAYLAWRFL